MLSNADNNIHDVCIYIYTRACMYYVHVAVKLLYNAQYLHCIMYTYTLYMYGGVYMYMCVGTRHMQRTKFEDHVRPLSRICR